jgi:hypothetical protein
MEQKGVWNPGIYPLALDKFAVRVVRSGSSASIQVEESPALSPYF